MSSTLFPTDDVTTLAARQVWEYAYPGEPWPEGWTVGWYDLTADKAQGVCCFEDQRIELSWYLKDNTHEDEVFYTLIHEFTHLRNPRLKHSDAFQRETVVVYGRMRREEWVEQIRPQRAQTAKVTRELRAQRQEMRRLREQEAELTFQWWWLKWQVSIARSADTE